MNWIEISLRVVLICFGIILILFGIGGMIATKKETEK